MMKVETKFCVMSQDLGSATMLKQTPSTHKRPIYLTKTQPTILSRANRSNSVASTIVKVEPSNESELVIVDALSAHAYTPHGPNAIHNYSSARATLVLDKTPQVCFYHKQLYSVSFTTYSFS